MIEQLREIICRYVEVKPEDITAESKFIEDLGFDSFTFMSMLGDAETEFGVTVDEGEIINIQTVGEAIKYLEELKK